MVTLDKFGNVPADLLPNANYTISILNEIENTYPGKYRFTSGYRSPQKNASVNGVANSYHIQALAGDFVPKDGRYPYEDAENIGRIVAKYGYEVVKHDVGSGLHYHIEPAPGWNGITQSSNQNNYLVYGVALLFLVLILRD